MESIRDLFVNELKDRLPAGITIELDDDAKTFLLVEGYNRNYGARPMRRAITKHLEDQIADIILSKKLIAGDVLVVTERKNELFIETRRPQAPSIEEVIVVGDDNINIVAVESNDSLDTTGDNGIEEIDSNDSLDTTDDNGIEIASGDSLDTSSSKDSPPRVKLTKK